MPPAVFRGAFILVFCALCVLRLYYRFKAGLFREPPYSRREPVGFIVARSALGLPLAAGTFTYCFFPGVWPWAYLPLSSWMGALGAAFGAACGAAALVLLLAAHRALGEAFSTAPAPRAASPLVTAGPYAWVRHPMYAAYFLLFVGAFLMSASWLIGVSGLAIIGLLMTLRRRHEETLLLARYGEEYERYRRCAGAFLPRPRPSRRRASTPRSSSAG